MTEEEKQPFRQVFTVMSWNLFKKKGVTVADWPGEREAGMRGALTSLLPDILCTQETAPEYLDTLLGVHNMYACIVPCEEVLRQNTQHLGDVRVTAFQPEHLVSRRGNSDGEESFDGWLEEGNILWRSDRFTYLSHGAIDIGLESAEARRPKRRLFWVRLKCASTTLLVATAHLTWEGGSGTEQTTPFPNTRSAQAVAALGALASLRSCPDEPVIFAGDMNDSWHVPFLMKQGGYLSPDFQLNMPSEITHPARPFFHEERIPSQTRDWIFSANLTPVLTRVCANMVLGVSAHPSDHFPVLAVFQVPQLGA